MDAPSANVDQPAGLSVLHVAASAAASWGGGALAPLRLCGALAQHPGVSVRLLATDLAKVAGEPVRAPAGVELQMCGADGWMAQVWTGHSPEMDQALARHVRNADVVHVHELWHYAHFSAVRAARRARVPYVVSPHGGLRAWALRHKRLRKQAYWWSFQRSSILHAAVAHAVSPAEESDLRRIGARRVVHVPNGIDGVQFRDVVDEAWARKMWPELDGGPAVVFLGRLHPIKGLPMLCAAFRAVLRDAPGARLVLAGPPDGDHLTLLRGTIRALGIEGRVLLPGLIEGDRKQALLRRADVFVLPSLSEVRGIAAMEAMASARPVVVTTGCDFPEIATAGAGVVAESTEAALAAAIQRVLRDPDGARHMGEQGRQLVLSQFTWQKAAERMEQIYRDLGGR